MPISSVYTEDLAPLLGELNTQIDTVLANVFVLHNVHEKHKKTIDADEKRDCAVILRDHGAALETELAIIQLKSELVTDERCKAWIDAASSAAQRTRRKKQLEILTTKMQFVATAMVDLRNLMICTETGNLNI
jgi:hypothetical protein